MYLILLSEQNLSETVTFVISLATLAAIVSYLYTSIAEFVIYTKHPQKINKKKVVSSLTISGLAFLYVFWVTISAGKEIVFYGVLLMFTSIPIYGWMQWKKYKKKYGYGNI